jgi:hypothetical protein
VYEASIHGAVVAVKEFTRDASMSEEDWDKFVENFVHEATVMTYDEFSMKFLTLIFRKNNHKNIVMHMGACTSVPGKLMMITEKMFCDLDKLLVKDNPKKEVSFTIVQRLKMAK